MRAINRASAARNPDAHREWVARNRDRVREHRRAFYARNSGKIAAKAAAYYQKNREARQQWQREHYAANKENYLKNVRVRRARAHDAGGVFTESDVRRQYVVQSGKCFWCDALLGAFHRDHLIPLAKGGTNGAENLVLACKDCNLSKGSALPLEWARRRYTRRAA